MKTKCFVLRNLLVVLAACALSIGASSALANEELSQAQIDQLAAAVGSPRLLASQFRELSQSQQEAAMKVLVNNQVTPEVVRNTLRVAWQGNSEQSIAELLIAWMDMPGISDQVLSAAIQGGYSAVTLVRADNLAARIITEIVSGGGTSAEITEVTRKLLQAAEQTPGLDSAFVLEQLKQAARKAAHQAGLNPDAIVDAVTKGALEQHRQSAGVGMPRRGGGVGGLATDDGIANILTPVIDDLDGVSK